MRHKTLLRSASLTLIVLATVAVAPPRAAFANWGPEEKCGPRAGEEAPRNEHCYLQTVQEHTRRLGVGAYIGTESVYVPPPPESCNGEACVPFVTNEMWVSFSQISTDNWIETGQIAETERPGALDAFYARCWPEPAYNRCKFTSYTPPIEAAQFVSLFPTHYAFYLLSDPGARGCWYADTTVFEGELGCRWPQFATEEAAGAELAASSQPQNKGRDILVMSDSTTVGNGKWTPWEHEPAVENEYGVFCRSINSDLPVYDNLQWEVC